MAPKISIIIRAKNEEKCIRETLEAIFSQEIDLPFEVVFIDSGSTDSTLEIARRFDVRIYEIEPGRFTFGFALNYGARLAKGKFIINLSAHCIPVNLGWMATLVEPLVKNNAVAATFGRQEPVRGLNPFEEMVLDKEFTPDDKGRVRPVFSNSNGAIKKEVLDENPFDEKAMFAEDFIWARTLPGKYEIRYVHSASVYHSHPLSLSYWKNRYYCNGLLEEYLDQVYGLKWHWKAANEGKQGSSVAGALFRYLVGMLSMSYFLCANKYYRYIPILPMFLLLRNYYYRKGMKEGMRLYSEL